MPDTREVGPNGGEDKPCPAICKPELETFCAEFSSDPPMGMGREKGREKKEKGREKKKAKRGEGKVRQRVSTRAAVLKIPTEK